jgi:Methyl-accepting chemotaxis protein
MSIALRLAAGFGAVMVLSLGLSVFQLLNFKQAMDFLDTVTQRDFTAYQMVVEIGHGRAVLWSMRQQAILDAALPGAVEHQEVSGRLEDYRRQTAAVDAAMERLATYAGDRAADTVDTARRPRWAEMAEAARRMVQLERLILGKAESMFSLLERERPADAAETHASTMGESATLTQYQKRVETLIAELAEAGHGDVQRAFRDTLAVAAVAITAMLLAAAAAGWVIGSSIGAALRRFMGFVQRVGQGDLTHTLPDDGGGELARMGAHLNGMRESLRNVATRTRAAAEDVNAATAQIRTSAQEQAAASAQQLSAIEQTTATLTEITESGAQITRRAQEVERNAQEAVGLSERGLEAVAETVKSTDSIREQVESVAATIVRLSERTQAIGETILTVNTIAERSHLLALNASIEAAAAGEHGRTFAVVAGEIKRLADQARDATGRVRDNLGEIQHGITTSALLAEEAAKRVEAGRLQSQDTDRTIRGLAEAIQESVQAFQQIVAATNQHQIGLEQVMQALASVRQAASQTSSTTRELEVSATNLNGLSEALVDSVRIYRL